VEDRVDEERAAVGEYGREAEKPGRRDDGTAAQRACARDNRKS
jgi:hypothetical protein